MQDEEKKQKQKLFQSVKWFLILQFDIVRNNLEENLKKIFGVEYISLLLVRNVPYFISSDLDISIQSQIKLLFDVSLNLQKVLL